MLPAKSTAIRPRLPNEAYTRSPSVVTVADAGLFLPWVRSAGPFGASACHSSRPSDRRKARIETRRPRSRAVVRKMRSSHTMGEEWPRPGTGTFQRTFSVSDHRSG